MRDGDVITLDVDKRRIDVAADLDARRPGLEAARGRAKYGVMAKYARGGLVGVAGGGHVSVEAGVGSAAGARSASRAAAGPRCGKMTSRLEAGVERSLPMTQLGR